MTARFRTLDPAMRESPQLDELSVLALLALDRLIQEADDEGRQYGDQRSVWRAVFPRDNAPSGVTRADVYQAADELVGRGLLVRYEVAGQRYLAFPGWRDGRTWQYQNVSRPKPSRFPEPPAGTCPVVPRGHGVLPPDRGSHRVVSDDAVRSHGVVAGDVDVDLTGRGRDADADADRTGARASPAPAPAEAGSGEARERRRPTRTRADEVRRTDAAHSGSDGRSTADFDLADRLRVEYRLHGARSKHGVALGTALRLHKSGDPEFEQVGHEALLRAQADRLAEPETATPRRSV